MIGIIGAMPIEVENIKTAMTDLKTEKKSMIKYHLGKLNGTPCVVAFSGGGKVNAAVCAQTMILDYNVKKIINVGVAGGLLDCMNTGDVVISSGAVQYDVDTTALGDPLGLISTINLINLPCDDTLREKALKVLSERKTLNIYNGIIASGDKFISKKEELLNIKNNFGAVACDMETGAISQVCYLNSVSFLSVRVISDNINKENSNLDYEKFKLYSAEIACRTLKSIIKIL